MRGWDRCVRQGKGGSKGRVLRGTPKNKKACSFEGQPTSEGIHALMQKRKKQDYSGGEGAMLEIWGKRYTN